MKTKKFLVAALVVGLSVSLLAPAAWAGARQHHRWEGVAIGLGAAVLGSALLAPFVQAQPARVEVYHAPPPAGHWEMRQVWVAPRFERVWNPGHYGRRHSWVPGHWIEVQREPGHYRQERVWVEGY